MSKITKLSFQGHTPHELLVTGGGAFVGISTISFLSYHYGIPLLIASFGASAVLIFGMWDSHASQPRNLIGGHVLSAFVGISCYQLWGNAWYAVALAMTIALVLMIVTHMIHPPGGATALICVIQKADYKFILMPVLAGALILLITAIAVNKCSPKRQYPLT